jgi:hypothetical protein
LQAVDLVPAPGVERVVAGAVFAGAVFDWADAAAWRPMVAASFARMGDGTSLRRPDAALAAEMRARFPQLRAYHAARPLDLAPYLRDGIRPLTADGWRQLVADCFLADAPPPSLAAAVMAAAARQFALVGAGMGQAAGRVHFCADARLLTERDGYHLLYGSLSLLAVAIQVDKAHGTDLKAILRRRGVPTIFVCRVATAEMEDAELAELARHLAHRLDGDPAHPSDPLLNFHFSLARPLPPDAILGHFQPPRVVDWVYGRHIGAS